MKKIIFLFTFALFALSFSSCGENGTPTPDDGGLKLSVSKTTMMANGTDKVEFTVINEGENVTSSSEIYIVKANNQREKLTAPSFTTEQNGTYTFVATYKEKNTNNITVTASGAAIKQEFHRKVCVFKFTGTWCSFCPAAGRSLTSLSNNRFPNQMIELAFHGGDSKEPMLIPETDLFFDRYKKGFGFAGYPSVIIDLRDGASADIYTETKVAVEKSIEQFPSSCGIRINSKVAGGKLEITTGVKSSTVGEYKIGVYIVESGLLFPDSPQNDGGIHEPNFIHNHVVRKMLSATISGDTMGTLEQGKEATKTYSVDINPVWNLEKLSVVVYAMEATGAAAGYINNVTECKANNGSVDYIPYVAPTE